MQRLLRIGIESKVVLDSHVQAISASLTDTNVTVLTVSHSGSTHETIAATRLAKEAGATTICISNFGRSPIQRYCDIMLHTMAKETSFRTEAMTSRIAAETLCQALATHVAPILTTATPDHPLQRIGLMGAFIIGLATTRSVLANPPVANLSRDELSRWAAPVFRQLLVGPAPS